MSDENPYAKYAQPEAVDENPYAKYVTIPRIEQVPVKPKLNPATYLPETLENIIPSSQNVLGGMATAVTHPKESITLLRDAMEGAGLLMAGGKIRSDLTPEQQQNAQHSMNVAKAIYQMYGDRYGGGSPLEVVQNIARTFNEDPIGVGADLVPIFGILSKIPKMGALSKVGDALNPVMFPVHATKLAAKVPILGAPAKGLIGLTQGVGKGILSAADSQGAVIRKIGDLDELRAIRKELSPWEPVRPEGSSYAVSRHEIVPGKTTTAAEAAVNAESPGFAALGESAKRALSRDTHMADLKGRDAYLAQIDKSAKTPEERARIEELIDTTSKKYYGKSSTKIIKHVLRDDVQVIHEPNRTVIEKVPTTKIVQGPKQRIPLKDAQGNIIPTRSTQSALLHSEFEPEMIDIQLLSRVPGKPTTREKIKFGAVHFKPNGVVYLNELSNLADRKVVAKAIAKAQDDASNEGVELFVKHKNPPGHEGYGSDYEGYYHLTGEGAHSVKLAIDDLIQGASNPITAEGKNTLRTMQNAKAAFLSWVEKEIPEYKTARKIHAGQRVATNQIDIGQAFKDKLYGALGQETASERANMLIAARKDVPKTIKNALTGAPRFNSLEEARLTPEMIKGIDSVVADLTREALVASQVKKASPIPDLEDAIIDALSVTKLPQRLDKVTVITNWVLRRLGVGVSEEVARKIAKGMQTADGGFDLVDKAIKNAERGKKVANFIGRTITNAAPIYNILSPNQQEQRNALIGRTRYTPQ